MIVIIFGLEKYKHNYTCSHTELEEVNNKLFLISFNYSCWGKNST